MVETPITLITTTEEALHLLTGENKLANADHVAIDTETVILRDENGDPLPTNLVVDGPGPWRAMSIAAKFGERYECWVLDMKTVQASQLNPLFENVTPWGWNATFDRGVALRDGLSIDDWLDAMIVDAVIRQGAVIGVGLPAMYNSLERAAEKWLNHKVTGKDDTRLNYTMENPLTHEEVQYAGLDAIVTLFLAERLEEVAKEAKVWDIAVTDSAAHPFLWEMEHYGLPHMDVEGYMEPIRKAEAGAAAAQSTIAELTSSQETLRSLIKWKEKLNDKDLPQDPGELVVRARPYLADKGVVEDFTKAVAKQTDTIVERLHVVLEAGAPQEDLFAPSGLVSQLPFDLKDETSIRKWFNKEAKPDVAEYLAHVGSQSKSLVKAFDLDHVFEFFENSNTELVANTARLLRAYRRSARLASDMETFNERGQFVPGWKTTSTPALKEVLNQYETDRVLAYTKQKDGTERLLGAPDSLNTQALTLIGGSLCEAFLDFKGHEKMLTTYGTKLLEHVHKATGRMHARYQIGLTGTGRLSSSAPNAQNLPPEIKPYMRTGKRNSDGTVTFVHEHPRALVMGDLSQAELRFLASMSGDENMLEAFRSGADLHGWTASLMFNVPFAELKKRSGEKLKDIDVDSATWKSAQEATPEMYVGDFLAGLRGKAKALSFGYVYGLAAGSLSQQLSSQGVPTTREEASELLAQFEAAYPQASNYMQKRVTFVRNLADQAKEGKLDTDYELSWDLHRNYFRIAQQKKRMDNMHPDGYEMFDLARSLLDDETCKERLLQAGVAEEELETKLEAYRHQQAEFIEWILSLEGATVLTTAGTPWQFESRTPANRRRLFQIRTDHWVEAMAYEIANSRRKFARTVTDRWVHKHNTEQELAAQQESEKRGRTARGGSKPKRLTLTREVRGRIVPLPRNEIEKLLGGTKNRELCIDFVSFVLEQLRATPGAGEHQVHRLYRSAMASCIRRLTNQFRNHPIQGGVADAMNATYGELGKKLRNDFIGAIPVQSVHDSIVTEGRLEDTVQIREVVKDVMEKNLAVYCPDVPCVADVSISLSLEESRQWEIQPEELPELLKNQ